MSFHGQTTSASIMVSAGLVLTQIVLVRLAHSLMELVLLVEFVWLDLLEHPSSARRFQ